MTEAQVGFLYNISGTLSRSQDNHCNTILQSYYLLRCKDITRGYGLPDKHFSSKRRCPNCCIEWKKNSAVKVRSIKLSKRQKQRLKSKRITQNKKDYIRCRKDLPISNEIVQICSFCNNQTVTRMLKPQKQSVETCVSEISQETTKSNDTQKPHQKTVTLKTKKEMNVYANALDVFSLQNKNNILASTIKEKPKIINNSKKKKDKFAGLCQKAVLASAKLKEQKKQQKGLDLFLKPSST